MHITSLSCRALVTVVATTVVTALLAPVASAAADCTWQRESLPILDGMSWSNIRITGVDGQGNVSGFYSPGGDDRVLARWTTSGVEIVPKPEGVAKFVTRTGNASGVVGAIADRSDGTSVAMTHTPGSGYRELPTPAGYRVWGVEDINNRGDVVGRVNPTGSHEWGAVLWRADGSAPEVIMPAGARSVTPVALGEDGTVLIDSMDGNFLWRNGALTQLPEVHYSLNPRGLTRDGVIFSSYEESWKWTEATGAVEKFAVNGYVEAVNDSGLAVGYLDDGNYTPVLWQGTEFVTRLPLSAGTYGSAGDAVSDSGFAAGVDATLPARWACR
ncbi:hypothetical protein GCM10022267_55370 [Lentzea roselyniae]|uniref:Uncharacterized protein n=1 Tax=Lentzea roselyniae TaxID=531940 RepID=A0ABP7BL57_9PSEU